MEKALKSNYLWYVPVFLSWLLPGLQMYVSTKTALSAGAFLVTVMFFYLEKNEKLKILIPLVITAAISIYDYRYLFLSLHVLFLMVLCMYSKAEKRNSSFEETSKTIYIALTFFRICYMIFCIVTMDRFIISLSTIFYFIKNSLILLVFALCCLCFSFKNKDAKNSNPKNEKNIFLFAFIGIVIDIVIVCVKKNVGGVQSAQAEFFNWYVFIFYLLITDNFVVRKFTEAFNKKFASIFKS